MFTKKTFAVLIAVVLLGITTNVSAWDGQRKGFILGVGSGFGLTSFTQEVEYLGVSETSDRENKLALNTDFKIGYAPNNTLAIYYDNKVSWFGITNALGEDVTITNGLSSLGVTYFFNQAAPSPFLSGGIGISSWAAPFEENTDTWTGFGLFVGGGYEFARHWSTEINLMWGNPSNEVSGVEITSNSFSLMFTVNVLGY